MSAVDCVANAGVERWGAYFLVERPSSGSTVVLTGLACTRTDHLLFQMVEVSWVIESQFVTGDFLVMEINNCLHGIRKTVDIQSHLLVFLVVATTVMDIVVKNLLIGILQVFVTFVDRLKVFRCFAHCSWGFARTKKVFCGFRSTGNATMEPYTTPVRRKLGFGRNGEERRKGNEGVSLGHVRYVHLVYETSG